MSIYKEGDVVVFFFEEYDFDNVFNISSKTKGIIKRLVYVGQKLPQGCYILYYRDNKQLETYRPTDLIYKLVMRKIA